MESKILVGIPCYANAAITKQSLDSIVGQDADILLVDNGSELPVQELLPTYGGDRVKHLYIEENILVNPVWNVIIEYFNEHKEYTHLIIYSSDVVVQKDWIEVLKVRFSLENADKVSWLSWLSRVTQDTAELSIPIDPNCMSEAANRTEGTPGMLITLNREQVELVSPLPEECKLWFGDEWIYTILRSLGYKTIEDESLLCYHHWSTGLKATPDVTEIIEEDKKAWEETVKPRMLELIESKK